MVITRTDLIQKYIDFFRGKEHHAIKNSSLIPENDPTVLFTTAGMHPLVPFLLGENHPLGKRLTNVQRCIRTGDIEEVGDSVHHTLFEMLGNWSLGDYFKEESIEWSFEFLTKILKIPVDRIAVSVFAGDNDVPKDNKSAETWKKMGISEDRIAFLPKSDNWWGPAGETGPCGPDTEIFYWKLNKENTPEKFDSNNPNWLEIWNNVFMEYNKNSDGKYEEAKQKNIDTGMGIERTVAVLNGLEDNYLADMWKPIIEELEILSHKKYENNEKQMRLVADHIKAAVFIIGDGVAAGNVEQGYILRKLIRRAIRSLRLLGVDIMNIDSTVEIAKKVIEIYSDYEHLQIQKDAIFNELKREEDKFQKTLDKGLREFKKMSIDNKISCKEAFFLYQSYGFPLEMIEEMAKEINVEVDVKGFNSECKLHQELSRSSSAGKFKSGLADNSDATKKLHTATHLLNETLRIVLDNPDVFQKGSNITSDRLRFDFNFDRKLTNEELKRIEDLVNLKIESELPIRCDIMKLDDAKRCGAMGVFDSKYDDEVKVYSMGAIGKEFSKEICAGPHVKNTNELGHFKIVKESSSSSGVRRIKAILE